MPDELDEDAIQRERKTMVNDEFFRVFDVFLHGIVDGYSYALTLLDFRETKRGVIDVDGRRMRRHGIALDRRLSSILALVDVGSVVNPRRLWVE